MAALALLLCACGPSVDSRVNPAAGASDGHQAQKPNILLIVADDLGYNDLAINNGNTQIDTPNLDQLAREGVRFTRHYATAVCSPARAALMTGYYPERVGYLPDARGISPQIVTLPERLREEGYSTWHIGKWHIGFLERDAWPDRQGFEHWFGFLTQWQLAGKHSNGQLVPGTPRYNNPWLQSDTEPGRYYPGHLEDILTARALEVIAQLQEEGVPWFVNLWFYAPHHPIRPAAEFAANYPDTDAGRYRALVNQLDHNIGLLLAELRRLNALQNTIVVVVSDNGGTNAHLDNNAPFQGRKTEVNEGGLRTPLIIRWPDDSLNGKVYADTVSITDIYPTLLDAIGARIPEQLDGVSFHQRILKPGVTQPRSLVWEIGATSYGVLSADGERRLFQPFPYYGITSPPRLYDLARDPAASHPLEPVPSGSMAQLKEEYARWYRDVHTVNTAYTPSGNGGVLRGLDFLRIPGFGPYTFGIAISDDATGPIVVQPGVWELRRTGNTITAQFGDLQLSGELQQSDGCHSIVVSGIFRRHIAISAPQDGFALTLYLDGVEVQSGTADGVIQVPDFSAGTIVGDITTDDAIGMLLPPVILNTQLNAQTPWTMETFASELCDGQHGAMAAQN